MPVAIGEVALEVLECLENCVALMLRGDEDVDGEAYDAIKPFAAPEFQSRRVRLALCTWMWLAGMLGNCIVFSRNCVYSPC